MNNFLLLIKDFFSGIYNLIATHFGFVSGFAALCLIVYDRYADRRHKHLSVKPILTTAFKVHAPHLVEPGAPVFSILVSNVGLGPALIDKVTFHFSHMETEASIGQLGEEFERLLAKIGDRCGAIVLRQRIGYLGTGMVIDAKEQYSILSIEKPEMSPEALSLLDNSLSSFRFSVSFKCIYGNKYEFISKKP